MRFLSIVLAGVMIGAAATAVAELDSAQRKEIVLKGREILARGDFEQGVKYFEEQVDAHSGDSLLLIWRARARQLAKLQAQASDSSDPKKQVKAAWKLHLFYLHRDRVDLAEKLDRKVFDDVKNAQTAAMLAQSLMLKGKAAEALKVLQSIEDPGENLDYQIQLGLALARTGAEDPAKKIAEALQEQEKLTPDQARDMALLFAKTGFDEKSAEILVSLFESLEPEDLDELRGSLLEQDEWKFLKEDPVYAKALTATAKNKGCGSDCSTCANCFN